MWDYNRLHTCEVTNIPALSSINKWRMDALRATRHIKTSQPQDAARLLATSRHWCGRDGVNGGDRSFGYFDQIHLWSNMRMVAAWLQPFNLDLNKCFGKWLLHSCMFIRCMIAEAFFEPLTQPDLSLSPQLGGMPLARCQVPHWGPTQSDRQEPCWSRPAVSMWVILSKEV